MAKIEKIQIPESLKVVLGEEKSESLQGVLGLLKKEFGDFIGFDRHESKEFISTRCFAIDKALGGGFARGRYHELFGPPSHGKTTLVLHTIAEEQANNGVVLYIDAEHALDFDYARKLGVDTTSLLYLRPIYAEQALAALQKLVETSSVSLVVIDSLTALIPKAELDKGIDKDTIGIQAKLFSKMFRFVTHYLSENKATVIFISQMRASMSMYGSPEANTGGNAVAFYCSTRSDIRRVSGGEVKEGNDIVGWQTRLKCVKNKVARPFQEAYFDMRFGEGIDEIDSLYSALVANPLSGIKEIGGGNIYIDEERYFRGKTNLMSHLRKVENKHVVEALKQRLHNITNSIEEIIPIPPLVVAGSETNDD